MSDPAKIGEHIEIFLGKGKDRGALERARVVDRWRSVAGEEVSRHSVGGWFKNGTLTVYVDSATWASELQAMSEWLKDRLNEGSGKEEVRSLRFVVSKKGVNGGVVRGGEREKAEDVGTLGTAAEGPQPPAPSCLVEEPAERVDDADLREAIRRAMKADLRAKGDGRRGRR